MEFGFWECYLFEKCNFICLFPLEPLHWQKSILTFLGKLWRHIQLDHLVRFSSHDNPNFRAVNIPQLVKSMCETRGTLIVDSFLYVEFIYRLKIFMCTWGNFDWYKSRPAGLGPLQNPWGCSHLDWCIILNFLCIQLPLLYWKTTDIATLSWFCVEQGLAS